MWRAGTPVDDVREPRGHVAWRVAAGLVVLAGVGAQLIRPLAPDLGPVPDPARWFAASLLEHIAAYRVPLRLAGTAVVAVGLAVPLLFAATASGRGAVTRVVTVVGPQRPARAATAVTVLIVLVVALVRVPLDVWAYRHAMAFGLSTRSLGGWILDWGLARSLEVVTAGGLTLAGYALARRRPSDWHVRSAALGVVVIAVFAFVAPVVIEPLWLRVTALPDGPVRQQVGAVLAAAGNPRAPLLVADASRRTTRQNAYVSGFAGTRRVVLYDTLLERRPEEVALVVAHELAHARHGDLARGVAAGGAGWAVTCWVVAATLRRRVRTGRLQSIDDPRGAAVALAVVVVLLALTTPLAAWASRRAEAAADLASLRLTNNPGVYCTLHRGFVERNLTDPAPPGWVRLWAATHPPPASRLLLAERVAATSALTAPRGCE